jgi:hypothetical protein
MEEQKSKIKVSKDELSNRIKAEELMEKRTIEYWKVKLLPQPKNGKFWTAGEALRDSKDWLYNSTKMLKGWANGEEVTELEFKLALDAASIHYVR